jgi:hypothetical protein
MISDDEAAHPAALRAPSLAAIATTSHSQPKVEHDDTELAIASLRCQANREGGGGGSQIRAFCSNPIRAHSVSCASFCIVSYTQNIFSTPGFAEHAGTSAPSCVSLAIPNLCPLPERIRQRSEHFQYRSFGTRETPKLT